MNFSVTITVTLKEGLLDPEGQAIQNAIIGLGFPIEKLKTARLFRLQIDAKDASTARDMATKIAERLLANPVIHRYEIEVAK